MKDAVEHELVPGESLKWIGQPRPHLMARRSLGVFFFGIPWMAFCCFWLWGASDKQLFNADWWRNPSEKMLFPAFGLIHFTVGLWMLASPLIAWRRATRAAYALTDRRAIVLQFDSWGGRETRTWPIASLAGMTLREDSSGSGDLVFEEFETGSGRRRRTVTRGFLGLEYPRETHDLLRALRGAAG
jgi:hypothetical protein